MAIKIFDSSRAEAVAKVKGKASTASVEDLNRFLNGRAVASSTINTATSALRVTQATKASSKIRKSLVASLATETKQKEGK